MTRMKRISLRTLVNVIGLFVAIVTAVSIPAGYLFVEYSAAANNLELKAYLKANRLAKYIYTHGELWQYQSQRLAELIEVPEANTRGDQQRVLSVTSKPVLEVGPALDAPVITQAAPIIVSGEN